MEFSGYTFGDVEVDFFAEEGSVEVTIVPLWVHLKNIPMDMYSWKGLRFVISAVGEPIRLHPETSQCLNFKVAKVFVNADFSKELPKSMTLLHQKENKQWLNCLIFGYQ